MKLLEHILNAVQFGLVLAVGLLGLSIIGLMLWTLIALAASTAVAILEKILR